jgi:hypothetical protein
LAVVLGHGGDFTADYSEKGKIATDEDRWTQIDQSKNY